MEALLLFAMAAGPLVGCAVVCRAVVHSVERQRRVDAALLVGVAGVLAMYGCAAASLLWEAQR